MQLLEELKRRNVIRMAGLYLVGAWLLVQVAGTLLPVFGAPDWVMKSVVGLLAIGFVPALIFSWVFELTPQGLKRDEDVRPEESIAPQTARRMNRTIIVVLLLALGYFAFDKFVLAPHRDAAMLAAATKAAAAKPVAAAQAKVDPHSIAVLPFLNMSGDKNNEYFSDGISEELLNVLVRVNDFSVASRTSSFAFKGREIGTPEIAKELKVKYVLEGSVRKQGDEVRITAQLIDAGDDRHLWSETFDRKLADIFKIQSDIANAIVTAVRSSLGEAASGQAVTVKADTANLSAYESYLKARELFLARTDLKESVRLYQRAVDLDPNFARAWEGLSAVRAVIPSWQGEAEKYYPLAKMAADRALALDSTLSLPWAAIGSAEQATLPVDWALNLSRFDRAIAADPKNATAYLWRAIDWLNLGFFDRALSDVNRCLAIDPAYQICTRWKALTYLYAGDDDRALKLFEAGVAAGFVGGHATSFVAPLARHGERVAARLLLRDEGATPEVGAALLAAISAVPPVHLSPDEIKHRYLGKKNDPMTNSDFDLWFGAFDQVATSSDLSTFSLPMWDPVRPDFRNTDGFKKTLERLGVADYWREHGYPPQCHAVGADDFGCDAPRLKAAD
jgi:TolB-like protein